MYYYNISVRIDWMIKGMTFGLTLGMIYGLSYGLIGNFIENKIEKTIILIHPLKKISKTTISGLIFGLILGLGIVLINVLEFWQILTNWENYSQVQLRGFKLLYGDNFDRIKYLITFWNVLGISLIGYLIIGLISGLCFGLIGNKIQTVETLKFYPKIFFNWLKNVLKNLAILGLILGPIFDFQRITLEIKKDVLIFNKIFNVLKYTIQDAITFVFLWLLLIAIVKLFSGIEGQEIENKKFPNQGIWQSVINSIFLSTITFFSTFLIIFGFQILKYKIKINGQVSIDSLSSAIALGILIGILTCGIPAIKHFILRVILWSSGSIPWNYAKFLNYCTNRLFLQRVGGSYRFMHDLLRQHFAKSYTQISLAPVQAIPVQPSAPQVQNHLVCTNSKCGYHNSANDNFCIKCGTKLNQPHI
ncbi:hypothetical protein AMR41_09550 [Hapalosiphon sp. MRB220]|nr:hypothetical protein AMR41_09550 [Hapalosiphon sp. MRB220]